MTLSASNIKPSDTVIREVTKDVWTFSKPFARFGVAPIGGRSTAIKLQSGDVWVLASTPLTEETKATIDKIGPVKYIMVGDDVHSLYTDEFKAAYPSAKVIGVAAVVPKKSYKFDGVYGIDPEGTNYGFEPEIQSCYFSGFINHDVAWFHAPSKTLIQADLLFNLPPTEQYSKSNQWATLPIIGSFVSLNPWKNSHKKFLQTGGKDKEAMKRDARTVASWDFTRIIPCHGDVIEDRGKEAWNEAYKWYIETDFKK